MAISDRAARGEYDDIGGRAMKDWIKKSCFISSNSGARKKFNH
jgi:molybdopterin biosynthesis enzyme MoaB